MAGFEGCANHGVLFNQGAGSQKWKALDIPGTQPPLSDVAVDLINYNYKYWGKQILFQSVMFLPLGSFFSCAIVNNCMLLLWIKKNVKGCLNRVIVL